MSSLLDRSESSAIKGILILLVVLGHCIPFVRLTNSWMVMTWLYLFHIDNFFILPYLYPEKPLSKRRILDAAIRFYIPFLILCIPLTCVNVLRTGNTPRLPDILLVLVGGGSIHLKNIVGVQYPWFLPAMFMASILRGIYATVPNAYRHGLFVLGWCLVLLKVTPNSWQLPSSLDYIVLGLRFLFLGVVVRWLSEKRWFGKASLSILIFVGSICFFVHYRYCLRPFYYGYYLTSFYFVLRLFMAPAFLLLLFNYRTKLAGFSFLVKFGEYSFSIYLIHTVIGYLANGILTKTGINDWLAAPICFTIMMFTSFRLACFLDKTKNMKAMFMPRGCHDFKKAWKGFISMFYS